MKLALFLAGLLLISATARDYKISDLLSFDRVSETEASPDGRWVAYSQKEILLEKNSSISHIWIVPSSGGEPKQLTTHEKGESRPRWSPDSKQIAFLSSRSGSQQIWVLSLDGGEARQVTKLSTGADSHVWSRTGKYFAFSSQIYPDLPAGDEAQKKRADEIEASGIKASVLNELLYRHWRDWRQNKRTHVFVVTTTGGDARDLTPGDYEAPPFSMGGPDDYAFSPDDREIAFTRGAIRPGAPKASDYEAWSTDANVCVVPVDGGEIKNLTAANRGWDGSPLWSRDGRFIAYRSQTREGYESDKFRLAILERASGKTTYLAEDLDKSVEEFIWSRDSRKIFFRVDDEAKSSLHSIRIEGGQQAAKTETLATKINLESVTMPADNSFFVGEKQSLTRPNEVARLNLDGKVTALTGVNAQKFADLALPSVEEIHYDGALGAKIQGWLLKPPGFKAGQRYPFLLVIHGGPQSAWRDAFSFRFNGALFASQGYVVLMPNPHGSTGFGQAFTEQISRDWPGACYTDLMNGVDWAIKEGLADPERLGAIGGSFGGYMVNWILGHDHRFKALASHAGVYNLESMYGATEELWFPEWELGGTPWKNNGAYEKFSPHKFAANFRTPTLVIHGELDFRVPISEGTQLFTALKRQGIESRMLYYPDEGHWILKPKNSRLWYETVFSWFDSHLKKQ